MKRVAEFTLSFLILICLTVVAVMAQDAGGSSRPQVTYLKRENIQIRFDPDKDETTVTIYPLLRVDLGYSEKIGVMGVTAGFVFTGRNQVSAPQSVLLRFTSISRIGWQFADEKELVINITANGESLFAGRLERLKAGKRLLDSKFYDKSAPNYREEYEHFELLGVSTPYEDFMKMANSEKVIIQVGGKKLKMGEKQLDAFRRLAQRMKV